MTANDALRLTIDMGKLVCTSYLGDLTDDDLLRRPHPDCNHINWQMGHLILSEHSLVEGQFPGSMPPLPTGFAERYGRESAKSNDPADFVSKAELLAAFESQRLGTLAALARATDADLQRPSGVPYAPTVAGIFELQGSHWLMHAGQWAVVRRQKGLPALF